MVTKGKFYLLKWKNDGGDSGQVLFDHPLTSVEQHDYMQKVYGSSFPDTDVSEWIHWEFGPIEVTRYQRKD